MSHKLIEIFKKFTRIYMQHVFIVIIILRALMKFDDILFYSVYNQTGRMIMNI